MELISAASLASFEGAIECNELTKETDSNESNGNMVYVKGRR